MEDPGLDENVVLVDLKELEYGSMDWIYLAQDTDQWHVLVTLRKYQILYNAVNFLTL